MGASDTTGSIASMPPVLSFADGAAVAVGAVTVLVFTQPKRDNSMMRTNANEKKRFFIICAPICTRSSKMQGWGLARVMVIRMTIALGFTKQPWGDPKRLIQQLFQ